MSREIFELKFGHNEKYIKTYCYCKSTLKGRGSEEIQKNLILTNKRLIIESKGKYALSREELPISNIERIDSNWKKSRSSSWGVILLILGLIICGIAIATQMLLIILGGLFFVIGLILLIIRKPHVSFELSFLSKYPNYEQGILSEYNFIEKAKHGISVKKSRKDYKVIRKVIVRVTPETLDMINELGAYLIDIKYYNIQLMNLNFLHEKKILSDEEYESKKKALNTIFNI